MRLAAQLAAQQEYAAAKPDPIAAFAGPVCGHMNDDHSDSTRVLVQHFVGVEVDEKPQLVGLDRLGFWARCRGGGSVIIKSKIKSNIQSKIK